MTTDQKFYVGITLTCIGILVFMPPAFYYYSMWFKWWMP